MYMLYYIIYSTPKHPFVRWLLEDRLAAYKQQKERQMSDSSVVLNDQPFSFHIGRLLVCICIACYISLVYVYYSMYSILYENNIVCMTYRANI